MSKQDLEIAKKIALPLVELILSLWLISGARLDLSALAALMLHILFTVVAVIFLPLGFLTGLLGINVAGMPGTEDSRAFWMVVVLCMVLGAALSLLFKIRRWF